MRDQFGQNGEMMKVTNDFLIPFTGLKLGKHQFDYTISQKFFESFDYCDFENCAVNVKVTLDKKTTFMELSFKHKGTVEVPCDVTGELFDLPIKGAIKVVVKFGDAFNNENEELLILPHGEHQIDITQYIYELIVLSVPQKRVHPGVKEGTLKNDALERLAVNSIKAHTKEEKEANTDPRWDKLKQLLTDK